mmetsp:Transcript_37349/g.76623  ORF Transcript_37349/g.76623 Transcript_37349/m.76623 type:complete len:1132 (-) Transcript_37349:692-4087(-)
MHLGVLGVAAHHGSEAVLVREELEKVTRDLLRVELEGVVARLLEQRVVAVQRPVARLHGLAAVVDALGHGEALRDARRVADHERGSGERLSLEERAHGLLVVHVDADRRHVHVLVCHGVLPEVLLGRELAGLGELGERAAGGGLGGLAAGVGVHLRVEHQDVHVLLGGEHVIESAETNVVGPAVAADDPVGVAAEDVALVVEALELGVALGLVLEERDDLVLELVVEGAALGEQHVRLVLVAHHRELRQELAQLVADRHLLVLQGLVHLEHELVTALLEGAAHAKAKLGVVLEEGVGPRGALAARVGRVRERRVGRSPDGGAAGGVGNDEALAKELGEKLHVRGLAAALAGARELKKRLLELRALDGGLVDLLAVHGLVDGPLPVVALRRDRRLRVLERERVGGADAHAELAARAVVGRNLDAEVVLVEGAAADGLAGALLDAGGRGVDLLVGEEEGAHGRVGADERAVVALRALVHVDARHLKGDATLLGGGGASGHTAAGLEGRDGEVIALLVVHGLDDLVDEVEGTLLDLADRRHVPHTTAVGERRAARGVGAPHANTRGGSVASGGGGGVGASLLAGGAGGGSRVGLGPGRGDLDLNEVFECLVDGLVVLGDDLVSLLAVHSNDVLLEQGDGLVEGHHARELEEDTLHDHVDALAHTGLLTDLDTVDEVELSVLGGELRLHPVGDVLVGFLGGESAVERDDAVLLEVLAHVVAVDVALLVDADVVGVLHEVRGLDLLRAEAQMRHSEAARLLGVVLEVALSIVLRVLGDELDGRLVRADGTVRAETVEQALDGALGEDVDLVVHGQREVRHVISDADSELGLGLGGREVLIHSKRHARGEILASETEAAADNLDVTHAGLEESGADVKVQRLALRADILAAVEHSNALDRRGKRGEELLLHPRAEEADLDHANLLAKLLSEVMNGLGDGNSARAHDHHHLLRFGVPVIREHAVAAAGDLVHLVRVLLKDGRDCSVKLVARLLPLEEHVGALVGALDVGVGGGEGRVVMLLDSIPGDEARDVLVADHLDFVDFVRGAETVEKVHNRDARLHCGKVRHQRLVHRHLSRLGAEHHPAGGPRRHNVAVVAEDVEGVRAQGARRNVEDAGQKLARNLVHVGDHEEETLRSGV